MRFEWQISFGQVIISVPLFWVMIYLMRLHTMMLRFRIEHEYLIRDWAARQEPPLKVEDLPTRRATWW